LSSSNRSANSSRAGSTDDGVAGCLSWWRPDRPRPALICDLRWEKGGPQNRTNGKAVDDPRGEAFENFEQALRERDSEGAEAT
jgi:hypothetical protein